MFTLLFLLLSSTLMFLEVNATDDDLPQIKLTDLLNLKDRAVDRLCQTTTNLLKNILVNCGGREEEKYCAKLQATVESLPSGCSLASESFNESVRKLAHCLRHRDQSCVDGLLDDMRSKVDQVGEVADMAVDRMKNL